MTTKRKQKLRSRQEQLRGLMKLGKVIGRKECNFWIRQDPGDVTFLCAADTPNASQIVYITGGYDVWSTTEGRLRLQAPDLSAKNAAKVVVTEYFLAKAARILQRDPKQDASALMKTLERGYQSGKKPEWWVFAGDEKA